MDMIETISTQQLLISVVILSAAFLIRGIAGFGSGLIAIPLLALMLPLPVVVPVVGLLDYAASASHGVRHRKAVVWRDLLPIIPFSLVGVVVALYLFTSLDAILLRKLLGGFILLYACYSLLDPSPPKRFSRTWAAPVGVFGGLISTLFGTGGPFYVIYLRLRGHGKDAFRATVAVIFLIDGASRITGYIIAGFISMEMLVLTAAALPVVAVAMYIGGHIHTTISAKTFTRLISVLLLGSGTALLFVD